MIVNENAVQTADQGRNKSRRNSLKHGLSGKGIVLPHEDQAAFDARLACFKDELAPVDAIQHDLVHQIAICSWRLERIALQERAALAPKVRQAAFDFRKQELAHVLELGRKLVDDVVPRGCLHLLGDLEYPKKVTDWNAHEPQLLVMELEQTVTGCDWMIDRWREISTALEDEGFLHHDNKYKMIRLLRKRPETLLDDRFVGAIVLNCRALHPEPLLFQDECIQAALGCENRPMFHLRVEFLEARMPEDRASALSFLRRLIDTRLAELHALRLEREPILALELSEAETRAAFDDSKEAQLRRRYESDCARQHQRALATLKTLQKDRRDEAPKSAPPSPPERLGRPARDASPPTSAPPRNERFETGAVGAFWNEPRVEYVPIQIAPKPNITTK